MLEKPGNIEKLWLSLAAELEDFDDYFVDFDDSPLPPPPSALKQQAPKAQPKPAVPASPWETQTAPPSLGVMRGQPAPVPQAQPTQPTQTIEPQPESEPAPESELPGWFDPDWVLPGGEEDPELEEPLSFPVMVVFPEIEEPGQDLLTYEGAVDYLASIGIEDLDIAIEEVESAYEHNFPSKDKADALGTAIGTANAILQNHNAYNKDQYAKQAISTLKSFWGKMVNTLPQNVRDRVTKGVLKIVQGPQRKVPRELTSELYSVEIIYVNNRAIQLMLKDPNLEEGMASEHAQNEWDEIYSEIQNIISDNTYGFTEANETDLEIIFKNRILGAEDYNKGKAAAYGDLSLGPDKLHAIVSGSGENISTLDDDDVPILLDMLTDEEILRNRLDGVPKEQQNILVSRMMEIGNISKYLYDLYETEALETGDEEQRFKIGLKVDALFPKLTGLVVDISKTPGDIQQMAQIEDEPDIFSDINALQNTLKNFLNYKEDTVFNIGEVAQQGLSPTGGQAKEIDKRKRSNTPARQAARNKYNKFLQLSGKMPEQLKQRLEYHQTQQSGETPEEFEIRKKNTTEKKRIRDYGGINRQVVKWVEFGKTLSSPGKLNKEIKGLQHYYVTIVSKFYKRLVESFLDARTLRQIEKEMFTNDRRRLMSVLNEFEQDPKHTNPEVKAGLEELIDKQREVWDYIRSNIPDEKGIWKATHDKEEDIEEDVEEIPDEFVQFPVEDIETDKIAKLLSMTDMFKIAASR